jgi:ABC-2 type transport system permease protein
MSPPRSPRAPRAGVGAVAAELAPPARASQALAQAGLLEQILVLARRSVKRTTRQPGQLAFPLIFPLLLFAVNSSGLTSAARLPHFPAHNYRDFALAVPFMQGALFVAISAGTDLARDIETGFLNRLALTPVRGAALLVGQLGGALVVGLVQSLVYLLVGVLVGVGIASGVGGALVLLALSLLIAFGFAGIGALLALRFGSGEAVQGFFPLLFVGVFLSSSNLPRNLIQTDWFRTIATYNPVSYLIEGVRSLIITGFDGRALALGFGIAGALALASLTAASVSLRTRLVRT